jgi:chromosome segregation ATPase
MKQVITNILIVIVGGLVVYSLMVSAAIGVDVKSFYNRIDSLQTKIDSAYMVNKELDNKISRVENNIESINQQITVVDNNKNIIKSRTNAKVNDVDTYTQSQLEKFFTDRYSENNPK